MPRVRAVEILFRTPIITKLLLEGEAAKIAEALARDTENGGENFTKALIRLYREKKLTMDAALKDSAEGGAESGRTAHGDERDGWIV